MTSRPTIVTSENRIVDHGKASDDLCRTSCDRLDAFKLGLEWRKRKLVFCLPPEDISFSEMIPAVNSSPARIRRFAYGPHKPVWRDTMFYMAFHCECMHGNELRFLRVYLAFRLKWAIVRFPLTSPLHDVFRCSKHSTCQWLSLQLHIAIGKVTYQPIIF